VTRRVHLVTLGFAFFLICVYGATVAGQRGGPASDPLVRAGVTRQVAPHTYVIPDGNVGLVPNVGIVVGDRATLVIDPGLGRRNGETVLAEVAKISRHGEVFVASTHFHAEHTTGAAAFGQARYVAARAQAEEAASSGPQQIRTFAARSPLTAELLRDAVMPVPAVVFDDTHTLDLGGLGVRLIAVGPTHTRGDTVLVVEGDSVVFTGDVVMNQSFLSANQTSSMRAWLAAFDTIEALRPRVIVPAHGEIGDGTLVAQNRSVMQEIQKEAVRLKTAGRSADEVATEVQQNFQARHPSWPRVNGIAAAARSAYGEAP
jgi:glyoxylase-like metal-dependent hydrolase (beta-lactamase superfamily II)